MSGLFTALMEGETKESLSAMVIDLRKDRAFLIDELRRIANLRTMHLGQGPQIARATIANSVATGGEQ